SGGTHGLEDQGANIESPPAFTFTWEIPLTALRCEPASARLYATIVGATFTPFSVSQTTFPLVPVCPRSGNASCATRPRACPKSTAREIVASLVRRYEARRRCVIPCRRAASTDVMPWLQSASTTTSACRSAPSPSTSGRPRQVSPKGRSGGMSVTEPSFQILKPDEIQVPCRRTAGGRAKIQTRSGHRGSGRARWPTRFGVTQGGAPLRPVHEGLDRGSGEGGLLPPSPEEPAELLLPGPRLDCRGSV